MKYRVLAGVTDSKNGRRRLLIKWLLYIVALIFSYTISRAGIFGFWQPVFIIPLSVAVAMREQELSSCVFALFCGLYIDCAFGFLFGFSAFWLISVSLAASLLTRNLVQPNLLNFCWLTVCAVLLEFFMDYLFNVVIWDNPNMEVILLRSVLPTMAATIILSPLVYFLVKAIDRRFGEQNLTELREPAEEESEDRMHSEQR